MVKSNDLGREDRKLKPTPKHSLRQIVGFANLAFGVGTMTYEAYLKAVLPLRTDENWDADLESRIHKENPFKC